jgi:hypothetical protein
VNALRELLAVFDIKVGGEAQLKSLDDKISSVGTKLKGAVELFAGGVVANAVKGFISEQIDLGSKINDTADRLGVGTDALQAFQFAAGLSGVEAEGAATALGFLNKNIGGALDGNQELAKTFTGLGVEIKGADGKVRELGDVIPEIADAFSKMGSDQERTAKAMQIFGRSGASLLPLLKGGSKGLKELDAEFKRLGGGLTKDFIEQADKAGDEIDKMKFAMTGLKSRIVGEFLPGLTSLVMKFQGVITTMIRVAQHTNIVKIAMGALAAFGVARLARSLLSLGPHVLAAIAIIAAIVLVVEDLYTLFTGGDSAIGDFIDALFGVGSAAAAVDYLKAQFTEILETARQLGPVFDLIASVLVRAFGAALPVLAGFWKNQIEASAMFFKMFVEGVTLAFGLLGKLISFAGTSLAAIGGQLGVDELKGFGEKLAATGKNVTATAETNPYAAGDFRPERGYGTAPSAFVPLPTPSSVSQSNQVEINVQGGSDPVATGRETAGALGGALNGAALQQAFGALSLTGSDE